MKAKPINKRKQKTPAKSILKAQIPTPPLPPPPLQPAYLSNKITTNNETASKSSIGAIEIFENNYDSPMKRLVRDLVVRLLQKISPEQAKNGRRLELHSNGTLIDLKSKLIAKSKKLNTGPDFFENLIESIPELIMTDTGRASSSSSSNSSLNGEKINQLCDFLCHFYEQKK